MRTKNFIKGLTAAVVVFFLIGCAAKEHTPIPSFSAKRFNQSMYSPKIDNFIIVFDASISMRHKFKEEVKLDIAKAIVERMNQTIPELGQTAGLRTFGHAPEVSTEQTTLLYGMTPYSTQDLSMKFDISKPGGLSKLGKALEAVQTDLEEVTGDRNGVIIISDGVDIEMDALASAQALKDKYGSICFYTILIGDAPDGRALLQQIAALGDCGFYSGYQGLLTSTGMANFVENEFIAEKTIPAAPVVMVKKDQKDTDRDGVYDEDDKCPRTPYGAHVNHLGCWTLDSVLFNYDKSDIKPETYHMINRVIEILENDPAMNVTLQGHTDNTGTPEYNMDLSLRRADAVKAYLVKNGIAASRLSTKGFGFSKPVALNSSEFGRSLNRRVEIQP
jgi:OOP family OmpA-OmpF porin